MYQEGTLRPPTRTEMLARYIPLEQIQLSWYPECWDDTVCRHDGNHEGVPLTRGYAMAVQTTFSTLELIEYHKEHVIPYEAFVVNDGYDGELALDWTHLKTEDGA